MDPLASPPVYAGAVPPVRIALASINPTVGDLAGNSELIIAAAAEAVSSGAALIVFPEMALTGYPVEDLALRPSFRTASIAAVDRLAVELARAGCGEPTVVVGFLGEVADSGAVRDLTNTETAPACDDGPPAEVADSGAGANRAVPVEYAVPVEFAVPVDEHHRAPRPTNSAAVIRGGSVIARYDKHRLPNYGVFDEERWFAAGQTACVVDVGELSISIAICEDLWQDNGPALRAGSESDLLLVVNASPFEIGKPRRREDLCRRRAVELGCTVAYVNLVGGQDELVFDGGSIVFAADGSAKEPAASARFRPATALFELSAPHLRHDSVAEEPAPKPTVVADSATPLLLTLGPSDLADCYDALVLGLRDYVRKNGQRQVLLGLSGGIDSALVAALACDAFGPDDVFAVAMPSRYSSEHSVADAVDLAQRTGLQLRTVPIEPMFAAFQSKLALTGLAEENLQARIRGAALMAISNAEGQLVLATGNKSEIAVGYSTIYGDAVGGFAPIKDVPKTLVWQLARYRNEQAAARGQTPPIPENCITKPPSAELRPDQLDADSLPDYAVLDALLQAYVEHRASASELVAAGFDREVVRHVLALTDRAEYKRRQYPPGPKITSLAFGRDRRLPITNRWIDPLG